MSVINRMLQDLEKRQADSPANASLLNQVRVAIPRERESAIPWVWLAISLLTIACVVLGYLYWKQIQPVPVQHIQQPPVSPAISPASLTPETSLTLPEARSNDTVTHGVEAKPVTASSIPLEKAVSHSAPNKSLPAVDQPKAKAGEVAINESPAKLKKTEPSVVSPPSPLVKSEEVKNIKEITPEQVAGNNYLRALVLLQQGRVAEAQAMLESVLKQYPKHAGARQALLGIMVDNRQTAAAIKLLQDGLELDPSRVEYAMALARLQVDANGNDHGTALATMEKYLAQGADRADYQGFLALLLERANRHKEAAQHYQTALSMSPDTAQWWMGLGISLQGAGDSRGAYQAYSKAKQLGTLSPDLVAFIDKRLKQIQQQLVNP